MVQDETQDESKRRAMAQFSQGSLYRITNQFGVTKKWIEDPSVSYKTSSFAVPETLRTTRHPVQDFWVYDGAYNTLGATGKVATSRDQLLPPKRVTEQQCIEWQRVGSKKGWMFNGSPQEEGPGGSGENTPTHTEDGYLERIKQTRWSPIPRSAENQELATRQLPAIDIENNARGIGTTGAGSGTGGMAGGYREINQERLKALPIPMAKYNWTGNRIQGTGREDQGVGSGAGGLRSGYASIYPDRPAFRTRAANGLSRG